MVELMYNGQIIGVFSSYESAKDYMREKHPEATAYQMSPLGTWLATDIKK